MSEPKLTLNIRSPSPSDSLAKAAETKRSNIETIDEAWTRIFEMKNSAADLRRLAEVKQAMEAGEIGRNPDDMYNAKGSVKRFSKAEALRLWRKLDEMKAKERLREMVEQTPDNYLLITDKTDLATFLKILDDEDEIVFDVETTGVDVWEDHIVGHVLTAIKADVHAYIPTKHDDPTPQLDNEYVNEKLRPYYEDESLGKIAHNSSFDIHMLDREGIALKGLTWDTIEAMKLLNENEPSYQLKPLITKYLRDESYTYSELFGDKGFNEVPLDQALAYAAKDGDITLKFRDFQRYHLAKMPNVLEYYKAVEVPIIPITVEMEKEGYVIDLEFAREYGDQLRKESSEYGEQVFGVLGDINLNSPAQLKKAIESHVGKEIKNTNADQTLKPMAKDYPIINALLKYRMTNKLLTTYIDVLPTLIKEKTGRVHTGMYPNGTVTGRFSSGSDRSESTVTRDGLINVQNQPNEARSLFITPEGYYIVNADFAAQEVRMIASVSGEEILLEAFANGRDPYATLGSRYYGIPYDECYKNEDGSDTRVRVEMKVVLLQSLYGASKYGIAESLGIKPKEAEEFRIDFFNTYRKIDAFIKETQDFVKRNGFVWIGDKQRKRRLPEARRKRKFIPYGKWNDPKYENERIWNSQISRAMRQGPNARIQGLAAMQTKVTMIKLAKVSKERGWIPWGAIHDELLVLMPETVGEEDFRILDEIMTQSFLIDNVENATDVEIQKRWGESISAEEFINGKEVSRI